jgi:16S rRNA G1207 methylase RsmC
MDIKKLKQDIILYEKIKKNSFIFHTTWGLFSPKTIDKGTMLLLENLKPKSDDIIIDIGCGYGVIGLALGKQCQKGKIHLVDKDFVAIKYAKKNANINRIKNSQIYLSNGFSQVPKIKFDKVTINIPGKAGKEMLYIILYDAKRYLKKGGEIYIVFISGLKNFIKRNLKTIFNNYQKIKQNKTYTVVRAVKK